MNATALAALASAWLLGGLLVAALWPRGRALRYDLALILPLGAIIGLGATSISFFAASLVSIRPALFSGVTELAAVLALGVVVYRRASVAATAETLARPPWSWLDWLLATLFAQALAIAAIVAWRAYSAEPYGGWDGWAIWNMHARFMLRAGPEWPALLAAPQLNWTHADYPWLVPASVARAWAWAGTEAPGVSAAISGIFALATVALLVAVAARRSGRLAAWLGGLLLVGTPFFLTFSTNQHADIPLGACLLAAVALAALGDHWLLAGLCAGFAAWTKNEGQLFAAVFAVVCGFQLWRTGETRRSLSSLATGLAIGLLPVIVFKLGLAPTNDLFAAPLGPRFAQLVDADRHRLILTALWRDVRGFGEWSLLPFLVLALPLLAWRSRRRLATAEQFLPAVILGMLVGYYAVYLLSPLDLAWHLDTSLVRLLLQLWPLALVWWALALPAFAPAPTTRVWPLFTRVAFAVANTTAAAGLFIALASQPAASELAVKRRGFGWASATLGDGWHGLERHAGETWAWSQGSATLHLHATGTSRLTPLHLRFDLRSLAPRQLVIRREERVIWQGAVGEKFISIDLAVPTLSSEAAVIEFITDTPATLESAAGGRQLAFAIYRFRLE